MNAGDLLPYVSALAIGLLIGFERERSHPPDTVKIGGSRTFALVALVGALAATFSVAVVMAGLVAVAAFLVVGYRRTSVTDPGTTTEIALFATYLLGAMAVDRAALAAALAIIMTVLLFAKDRIHAFARTVVSDVEFEDALKFAVIAFVVLPLLPDRDLGPYGALNPHQIWLLVVSFTAISWVGYIAVRVLGARRGLLLTGLAGGFVSASATTASMARLAREERPGAARIGVAVGGALLASVATFVQLVAIMLVAAPALVPDLWPACAAGAVVLAGLALLDARRHHDGTEAPQATTAVDPSADGNGSGNGDGDGNGNGNGGRSRPFALRSALVLALVLTLALLVGRWAVEVFGVGGVYVASAAAGLADAHAGALAAAELHVAGAITTSAALVSIGLAMAANTVTKVVLGFTIGGRRFGTRLLLGVGPAMVAFLVGIGIGASIVA